MLNYEYIATVTQLAATSEVTVIGLLFTAQSYSKIIDVRAQLQDQDAGVLINAHKRASNSTDIRVVFSSTLDDNSAVNIQSVQTDLTGLVDPRGFHSNIPLSPDQQIRIVSVTAIDAETTITISVTYESKKLPLSTTAIGAGISISSETHKSV